MLEEYRNHNSADPYRLGERYLTMTELRAKLGGRSRSAIYLDLAAGRLPPPIKLGGRLYFPEGDVDAHLRNLRERTA
jgi:prophage regulatory protein